MPLKEAYIGFRVLILLPGYHNLQTLHRISWILKYLILIWTPRIELSNTLLSLKNTVVNMEAKCYWSPRSVLDNVIDPLDLYKDDILFPGDPIVKSTVLTLGCNLLFTTRLYF